MKHYITFVLKKNTFFVEYPIFMLLYSQKRDYIIRVYYYC